MSEREQINILFYIANCSDEIPDKVVSAIKQDYDDLLCARTLKPCGGMIPEPSTLILLKNDKISRINGYAKGA
ncbi:hypothetical protein [Dehalobacterium formicoaceticum]|uniref:Uncharacterized protein n=1 Tax=Dehalobacterium formicoaceticum TaxID=51515 RepID=A0ABT1Y477_9FIRM|nr:hypothetical protein [Dehalobacterium formicoaceticum]MCR6545688.1 hypothetical protein [Dehalobacterium formicoaceticum]